MFIILLIQLTFVKYELLVIFLIEDEFISQNCKIFAINNLDIPKIIFINSLSDASGFKEELEFIIFINYILFELMTVCINFVILQMY